MSDLKVENAYFKVAKGDDNRNENVSGSILWKIGDKYHCIPNITMSRGKIKSDDTVTFEDDDIVSLTFKKLDFTISDVEVTDGLNCNIVTKGAVSKITYK